MKSNKKHFSLPALVLVLLLTLGQGLYAFADNAEEIQLSDWQGNWNNIVAYFDDEELADDVEARAEEFGLSVEEFIERAKKQSTPFDRLEIDGDTINFIDDKDNLEGDKESAAYTYSGKEVMEHAGKEFYWHVFETESKDATYPVVLLMEVHGEEKLAHFHLRCGDSVKELMNQKHYPTFVSEDTLLEMIAETLEQTKVAPKVELEFDEADEISLADWSGRWHSVVAYLEDEALADVVTEAAEDHQMNVEDFIEHEQEESGTPFEAIIINDEDDTVTFLLDKGMELEDAEIENEKDSEETESKDEDEEEIPKAETFEYTYSGKFGVDHGGATHYWYVFESENKDARYPVILLMEIHGEEKMAHFHIRVGDSIDELAAEEDWNPTFVDENMLIEMIAEEIHHDHDHEDDHDHESKDKQ